MAEYIEREVVIRELRDVYEREFPTADGAFDLFANRIVPRVIKNIPTAEVVPVRHGHWIFKRQYHDADECNCSNCGQLMTTVHGVRMAYCPQCGFIMDGGADNEV